MYNLEYWKISGCLQFEKRNNKTKRQVWINQKESRNIEVSKVREEMVRVSKCSNNDGKETKA